jgi:serine/threonine protein kinase
MDLRQQLASTLGTYVIERELGGGGMSRVFLATETALGRSVVIKVRLEEGQGRAENARHAYARFLELYQLPGPRERRLVSEAQSALARLAGKKE